MAEPNSPPPPFLSALCWLVSRGRGRREVSTMRPPGERAPIVGPVHRQPSPLARPARCRSAPPPAAGIAATTSTRPARPAAIPPRAVIGAAPPGGPVAGRPTLRCRPDPPDRWPGSAPRSPDRPASWHQRCGPGPRTGIGGPVLGEQRGQQAGRQRGPRPRSRAGLLIGDQKPALVAVVPTTDGRLGSSGPDHEAVRCRDGYVVCP
jgi:hypothetical protein